MYIDGDTHYWPVPFIKGVDHPGRTRSTVKTRLSAPMINLFGMKTAGFHLQATEKDFIFFGNDELNLKPNSVFRFSLSS